jgi:hypothetical protein
MTENKMDINRELAGLLGICWHNTVVHDNRFGWLCRCGKYKCEQSNPDFTTDSGKIELLRLMEKHLTEEGLNGNFWEWVYCLAQSETKPERVVMTEYMLNTTGLLSQAAREWLKKKEGKG